MNELIYSFYKNQFFNIQQNLIQNSIDNNMIDFNFNNYFENKTAEYISNKNLIDEEILNYKDDSEKLIEIIKELLLEKKETINFIENIMKINKVNY